MYEMFLNSKIKTISIIGELVIFILSILIKKDNNIWVFGAIRGQKYMDNSKYLFEYVNKYTDIHAIWISKNKDVVDVLNQKGFTAFYEYSAQAIYYAQRAKVAVITHRGNRQKSDLPFYTFNKHTNIIQLWHGLTLKKIGFDDDIFSFKDNENSLNWKFKKTIKKVFFPFLNYINQTSLTLSLSKETQDIFSKAFRVDKSKVIITGYPRNDTLLKELLTDKNVIKTKKVVYMPTFRGRVDSSFNLFNKYNFDILTIDTFLEKENMCLDIKLHPFNKLSSDLRMKLEKSKYISLLENDDIYEVINQYDILVTDYSSIYFDYLLLNRPIIFAPFDKETYLKQDREFYFDYDEVTPGPKANDWDEVLNYLREFNKSEENYCDERKKIKNRFHHFEDTNSSKRVYEAILDISK